MCVDNDFPEVSDVLRTRRALSNTDGYGRIGRGRWKNTLLFYVRVYDSCERLDFSTFFYDDLYVFFPPKRRL